ncbi:MAG: hypothetical protein WC506_05720 [Candidatus Micrarchaeia archaeon]
MLFQTWLSKEGPEIRQFQPSRQDNVRVSQPRQFTSEISKKPYFSVTDQIFKNEYQFVFGPDRISVHLPKIILSKQEIKGIEAMIKSKDVQKSEFAATLVPALEELEKIYQGVPGSGNNAWGVIPRKFKPLELIIVEDGTITQGGLGGGRYEEPGVSSPPRILLEKSALSKSPFELGMILTHEGSHWLYDAMLKTPPKNEKTAKAMTNLRNQFILMSSDTDISPDDLFRLSFSGGTRRTVNDSAPLFAFFEESTYTHAWASGHPYDNPDELFASATAVLSGYPQEFFTNIEKFLGEKPGAVKLLFGAAQNVILLHRQYETGDSGIFPKECLFLEKAFSSYIPFSRETGKAGALLGIARAFSKEFSHGDLDAGKLSALLDIRRYEKGSQLYLDEISLDGFSWQAYMRMSYLLENHKDAFMKNVSKLGKAQQDAIMRAAIEIMPEGLNRKVYTKSQGK